jgi:hypothetical protein
MEDMEKRKLLTLPELETWLLGSVAQALQKLLYFSRWDTLLYDN